MQNSNGTCQFSDQDLRQLVYMSLGLRAGNMLYYYTSINITIVKTHAIFLLLNTSAQQLTNNIYIYIFTSDMTVLIVPSKANVEQVSVPFPSLQDLYCDMLRRPMMLVTFSPIISSRHHQSGTAAPNTINSKEKHTIHFIQCTITDNNTWNFPHPPVSVIMSSSCATELDLIFVCLLYAFPEVIVQFFKYI